MKISSLTALLSLLIFFSLSFANEADVLKAKATCNKNRICSFKVTIKHTDKNWNHYVNGYEILTLANKRLAKRTLHHPHINEQPFTRSISGVKIPINIDKVIVRAHDLIHGNGGKEVVLKLFD